MPETTSPRPLACVTGASSGLGSAFAERLARDRYDLILVARRRDRLAELAQRLSAEQGAAVEVIPADLTQPDQLRVLEHRLAADPPVDLLINNAGFGAYMPFLDLDPDLAEGVIRLQVVAPTRLTRAALPGMVARGRGGVINVSSMLAFSGAMPSPPLPKRATYAGAKAYLNQFSMLLAAELEGTGVQVQALCPGVVQTEFHERVGMDPSRFPAALVMQPDSVVQASLAALRLGEAICAPGLEDAAILAQVYQMQADIFRTGRVGTLASRYQP